MPVEIYPSNAPATLAVECRDIVTHEEIHYILERCLNAVRAHPVHFLIDCSELSTLAPGALSVLANFGDFLHHPNTRWLAVVTRSALLKQSIRLLFGDTELRFFEDREAADQFLRAVSS